MSSRTSPWPIVDVPPSGWTGCGFVDYSDGRRGQGSIDLGICCPAEEYDVQFPPKGTERADGVEVEVTCLVCLRKWKRTHLDGWLNAETQEDQDQRDLHLDDDKG